jgi:hypothetical protein
MSGVEQSPETAQIMAVLDKHRWKTMSPTSVECECGVILYPAQGDEPLTQFPADESFRWHVAAEVERAQATGPGWFWTRDEWSEWSNDLAMLIPEDDFDRYSNPDGAQESCITDVLRAYVEERTLRPGRRP